MTEGVLGPFPLILFSKTCLPEAERPNVYTPCRIVAANFGRGNGGTRIPVEYVKSLLRKDISESEILEDFPQLSAEDLAYVRCVESAGKGNKVAKRLIFKQILLEV